MRPTPSLRIDLEATDRFREKMSMGKPTGSAKLKSRAVVQACRIFNKRKRERNREGEREIEIERERESESE